MRLVALSLAFVFLTGCDFIGGADTLIRGSNNVIAEDGAATMVATALADFETIPAVTDEELASIYGTIREQAMAGNLEAIQVLLRLAAIQRAPIDEEPSD